MKSAIIKRGKKVVAIFGIAGDTFNANDIVGKTLIAKTSVNVRSAAGTDKPLLYVAHPGDTIGVVYSWQMKGADLWWMIEHDDPEFVFVQHAQGRFDQKSLEDQGAQTTADKAAAEAEKNKSFTDKLIDFAKSAGMKILIVGGVAYLGGQVIKKKL